MLYEVITFLAGAAFFSVPVAAGLGAGAAFFAAGAAAFGAGAAFFGDGVVVFGAAAPVFGDVAALGVTAFFVVGVVFLVAIFIRITSYNVCYTKLLRLSAQP